MHWLFGKHAKRPPDPDRTAIAVTLPKWQADLVVDEIAAADIAVVLADDHMSHLFVGSTQTLSNVMVAETDVAATREIIERTLNLDGATLLRPIDPDHDGPLLTEMLRLAIFIPDDQPVLDDIVEQPELARYIAGFGERDGDCGWVALDDDGAPIGAAWVRRFRRDQPGYGYVDEVTPELTIAVRPEHRDRGVGSALLTALIDEVGRISLSVDARNSAVTLYERFGFAVVRSDGDSLVMLCG